MAAQFGDTLPELGLQHLNQALYADLIQVCLPIPLAIKVRKVTDRGVFPQRDPVLLRQIKEVRKQLRVSVHVMMRIKVGGQSSYEFLKARELCVQLCAAVVWGGQVDN
jgi:hypothetical protein